MSVNVFISRAEADDAAFRILRQHLRPLEQAFTTPVVFSDDSAPTRIEACEMFILLLSPAYLATDRILNGELPAIRTRSGKGFGLVCPVVLTRCAWKPLVGHWQVTPMQNRRLLPVDEWDPPAQGFDAVRDQIEQAMREWFGLTRRRTEWFTPALDHRQAPDGPMLVLRHDRFDLDTSGGEADRDATADPEVRRLYVANRAKAADVVAMVKRYVPATGSEWDHLETDTAALAEVLAQPLERLPEQVTTLWERSVRVASSLFQDEHLRAAPEADKAPLDADLHQALADLVGSVGPWVRSFPTARLLDDQRGAFLRTKLLFDPAKQVSRDALAAKVVTPLVDSTFRSAIDVAERGDAAAEKAGFYAISGLRNLLVSAARYAATYLSSLISGIRQAYSALIDYIGAWFTKSENGIIVLVQDFSPDLRVAIGRLRDFLTGDNRDIRDRFVVETNPLPAAELSRRLGGANVVERWVRAGDIFSVRHRGVEYFPAFQFQGNRPNPVIRTVLTALPADFTPWQRAFWFVSTNGWLGDAAPVDMLDDPDALIAAAQREVEEVVG